MRTAALVFAALTLTACEEGGEGPRLPDNAMPVAVQAADNASYELRCRFRTVDLPGNGKVNSTNLSGKGPKDAAIPTDNTRCELRHTGGDGPVTVTVTKNGRPAATATAAGPGATATLQVL
jgi:hypothetical protein